MCLYLFRSTTVYAVKPYMSYEYDRVQRLYSYYVVLFCAVPCVQRALHTARGAI